MLNHNAAVQIGVTPNRIPLGRNRFEGKPAAPLPAQLHLSNAPALLVDNETVAGLLQQILAGNLQSVESRGRPLAVPSGGKLRIHMLHIFRMTAGLFNTNKGNGSTTDNSYYSVYIFWSVWFFNVVYT